MDDPTPSKHLASAKIEPQMKNTEISAIEKLLQNPDFAMSIHDKKFKKHLAFDPEALLKRLDPRSQAQ